MTALVTGGTRGIGLAISCSLAAAGHDVSMLYRSDDENAAAAVDAVGEGAMAIRADVSDVDQMRDAYGRTESAFGEVNVVVHSAVLPLLARAVDCPVDYLDQSYRVGPRAFFLLCQRAAETMPDGGRIIFVSSLGTQRAAPGYVAIGAAKGAGDNLVRAFAAELARKGITVNSILAPNVESHHLEADPHADKLRAAMVRGTPVGRMGTEDDVANAVVMLCRPEADFIVGQQITPDGGFSMSF